MYLRIYTTTTSSVIIPCLPEICNFKINLFYIYFTQRAMITLKLWLSLAMNRTASHYDYDFAMYFCFWE